MFIDDPYTCLGRIVGLEPRDTDVHPKQIPHACSLFVGPLVDCIAAVHDLCTWMKLYSTRISVSALSQTLGASIDHTLEPFTELIENCPFKQWGKCE